MSRLVGSAGRVGGLGGQDRHGGPGRRAWRAGSAGTEGRVRGALAGRSQIYKNITRTILLLQIDMANLLGSLSVLCLVLFSVFSKFSD